MARKGPSNSYQNPFDSDDEDHPTVSSRKANIPRGAKPSSKPGSHGTNPFDDEPSAPPSAVKRSPLREKHVAKNNTTAPSTGFSHKKHDSARESLFEGGTRDLSQAHHGGRSYSNEPFNPEGQSVQELQSYAVKESQETTKTVYNCLKVAEEMKGEATKTLLQLNDQGEQIERTHYAASDIDKHLSRGEKLLGSLGGLFSKTWKPTKAHDIKGPVITRDNEGSDYKRKAYGIEQRASLGLSSDNHKTAQKKSSSEFAGSQFESQIQEEFKKQDDALSDLSNVLEQLKDMSVDMGSELIRQDKALDHMHDDVTELGYRVKGANERTRRLLGK